MNPIPALLSLLLLTQTPPDAGSILTALPVPEGMRAAGEVAVYPVEQLADYIDGAAELYRTHGVLETATVAYRTAGSELPELTVDLHRMAKAAGAQAIYDQERSPMGERLYLGSGGTWQTGMLTLWDGPYYARIISELPRESTEAFARELVRLLPTGSVLMPIFTLFPKENRIPKGEEHITEPLLGLKGLNDVWRVRYRDAAGDYELFLRRNRPPLKAADIEGIGAMKAVPSQESPIQRIDLNDGRILLIFYIKMNPNLAGYLGSPPDSARQIRLTTWVSSLPLETSGSK